MVTKVLRETHKDSEGVRKKAKKGERMIKAAKQKIGSSRFSRQKNSYTLSLQPAPQALKERRDREIFTSSF